MSERGDVPGPVESEITAALRAGFGDPPADVNWETMSERIGAAARFRLASRRRPVGWSAAASRWARVAVPAALAASLLLAAGLSFDTGAEEPLRMEDVVAAAAGDALPSELAILMTDDGLGLTLEEAGDSQ